MRPTVFQTYRNQALVMCLGLVIALMAAITPAAAEGEETPLPTYYPLDGIAVQYESKHCGYRTVVITAQLELGSLDQTERVTAYTPRINANLYAAMTRYLKKNKKVVDSPVRQIIKTTVNKILGKDYVKDVLLMNILHQ